MKSQKIGWIGLGTMGVPMVKSLLSAGYSVIGYNRSPEKAAALQDERIEILDSPVKLIAATDVVIVMVSDDQAIKDIFEGVSGLLSAEASGKIIINMSTVSPAISIEMEALCLSKGHHYIDAPVSGSVKQATEATLVIIAGGDEQIFDEVTPILESMGKLVIRFGAAGSGNRVKLIVNTFLAIQAQALAEAMAFAEQLEVDQNELMTVFNSGALASPFVKIKGEAILAGNYKPAFSLNNIVKDLKLAADIGLKFPLGTTALSTFSSAAADYGSDDIIGVINALRAKR